MNARIALLPLILLLLPSSPVLGAEPLEVTGQVLGSDGEGIPGIDVASYWTSAEGRWKARGGVKTDDEGRFTLKARLSRRARSLMALDASQEQGGLALLSEETAKKPLTIKLQPTTLVAGAFENKGLGRAIEKTYVSFTAKPASIAVASHVGAPSFTLRLPPAEYRLMVGGVDCERIVKRIALTRDMRTVDLGTTDLQPTIIAKHYGKEPPAWHVADARGVDPKATLADFKGKWVLLEFWGHW